MRLIINQKRYRIIEDAVGGRKKRSRRTARIEGLIHEGM